jgi:hypothetical protein
MTFNIVIFTNKLSDYIQGKQYYDTLQFFFPSFLEFRRDILKMKVFDVL